MEIRLEEAKEGMTVNRDITLPNGLLLVEAGVQLTTLQLNSLFQRNIEYIDIIPQKNSFKDRAKTDESIEELLAQQSNASLQTSPNNDSEEDEFEEDLHFLFSYITDKETSQICEKATFAWELEDKNIDFSRIKNNEIVLKINPTVTNLQLEYDKETILFNAQERLCVAKKEGILLFLNNRLSIHPLIFDGTISIDIAADKMEASITIHPPFESDQFDIQSSSIEGLLAHHNITHGLQSTYISELQQKINTGSILQSKDLLDTPLTVVKGKPSINGKNGFVEYNVSFDSKLKPKENDDGSVDFKNVQLFNTVKQGDVLAHLIPETSGEKGYDIFGKVLESRSGAPSALSPGKNTKIPENHPNSLIATADGVAVKINDTISVDELLIVKEDIGYSTGNINYEKSIKVMGDVLTGFVLNAGGDIMIDGSIEDATITCKGSLLCKHGFSGHTSGTITSGGNVNIGFVKNQTIKAEGHITIANEVFQASLYSRRDIICFGQPISVAGGHLIAGGTIEVYKAGNESNSRTIIESGVDFLMLEKLSGLKIKLKEIRDQLIKYLQVKNTLEQKFKILKKNFPSKDMMKLKKLNKIIPQQEKQMQTVENLISSFTENLYNKRSKIIVKGYIMPNTIISIAGVRHFIREEVTGPKTILIKQGQIQVI